MAEKKDEKKVDEAALSSATVAENEPNISGIVDGKILKGNAYLDAAEKAGYDRNFLMANPERRPAAISTK